MYDIIGDIHGHADELIELLEVLDYECQGGVYRHPNRTAIFVGDFIDRGPQILETLRLVRAMHEAESALAVMGNHEFNALAYHTPDPVNHGRHLREHSDKNKHQHAATLSQVSGDLEDHLEWIRRLPLWLEINSLRIVHACWDAAQIEVIKAARTSCGGGVSTEFLCQATKDGTPLYKAVEDVLKGKEWKLPEGKSYRDKDGHERHHFRIKWFRAPANDTYASYAFTVDDGLPSDPLSTAWMDKITTYPADAGPVFFGHYWLRSKCPTRQATNVACVDYSVAKGGMLCAYRWDGERELSDDKFVPVPSRFA